MTAPVYFEQQVRQLCLKHTLNNLFQRRVVSAAELDDIAAQLPGGRRWFGPHRTLWLGNYGVSVVELALAQYGKDLRWHDSRKGGLSSVAAERCWALILNVRSDGWLAALTNSRHWFGVKRFGNTWYNLDSQLAAPKPLLGVGNVLEDEWAAEPDGRGGAAVTSSSPGTEDPATTNEQRSVERVLTAPRALCVGGAIGAACAVHHHDAAAVAQSTAALLQFLRHAVDHADALLFEVREHDGQE